MEEDVLKGEDHNIRLHIDKVLVKVLVHLKAMNPPQDLVIAAGPAGLILKAPSDL